MKKVVEYDDRFFLGGIGNLDYFNSYILKEASANVIGLSFGDTNDGIFREWYDYNGELDEVILYLRKLNEGINNLLTVVERVKRERHNEENDTGNSAG